jgi:hypothetical protein
MALFAEPSIVEYLSHCPGPLDSVCGLFPQVGRLEVRNRPKREDATRNDEITHRDGNFMPSVNEPLCDWRQLHTVACAGAHFPRK